MNPERIYKVLLGPVVSEKSSVLSESTNQVVFRVATDATKEEVKAAVEQLFEVKVAGVRTAKIKGKNKSFRQIRGRRSDWKKAYVSLEEGQDIELMAGA